MKREGKHIRKKSQKLLFVSCQSQPSQIARQNALQYQIFSEFSFLKKL